MKTKLEPGALSLKCFSHWTNWTHQHQCCWWPGQVQPRICLLLHRRVPGCHQDELCDVMCVSAGAGYSERNDGILHIRLKQLTVLHQKNDDRTNGEMQFQMACLWGVAHSLEKQLIWHPSVKILSKCMRHLQVWGTARTKSGPPHECAGLM